MAKKKKKKAKKLTKKKKLKKVKRKAKKSSKSKRKPKKVKRKAKKRPKSKKKAKKKTQPPPVELPWRKALPGETLLGVVDDFFAHVSVFAITLKNPVSIGDRIHIRGHTTDIIMPVSSMQIEHQPVNTANPGDSIGIRVGERVRKGDYIYKIS